MTGDAELEIHSVERRDLLRADLTGVCVCVCFLYIYIYEYLMGGSKERGDRFFLVAPVDRTRGDGQQLIYRKSHSNLQLFVCVCVFLL